MGGVPHPIPYQGSKRSLAEVLLTYFPTKVERLVEPFAGSAAVSIAAAHFRKADTFWLNDLNAPLVDLWRLIVLRPKETADAYEMLWRAQLGQEREFYGKMRDEFNHTARPDLLLYLLTRCVKAAVRYNSNGEFNQSPDHRRKGTHPTTMRRHIMAVSSLFRGRITFTSLDYTDILSRVEPSDLVYMDPPYQGVCENHDPRYLQGVTFEDFVGALAQLNHRGCSFIVSYDGRTGNKSFGRPLPDSLRLEHMEIEVGRSSQATLLGRKENTVESIYVSPALASRLEGMQEPRQGRKTSQLALFGS